MNASYQASLVNRQHTAFYWLYAFNVRVFIVRVETPLAERFWLVVDRKQGTIFLSMVLVGTFLLVLGQAIIHQANIPLFCSFCTKMTQLLDL